MRTGTIGTLLPATLAVTTAVALTALPAAPGEAGAPGWDAAYTAEVRANTTGPNLTTPLVDHLPASSTVPTPLAFLGYVAGAEGHLTYAKDVDAYMRALAAASPRVKVFPAGTSEEGREMVLVVIADEATIGNLERYKRITRALSDPRGLAETDAAALIAEGKPIYYLTGALHSPETGSPEMLMELAYRLAVEDTPLVRSIRENVITLITPVLEVDGRERMVDLVRWAQAHPGAPMPPPVYWGHYVAHDNNRDAIGLALALTRNVQRVYFDWRPQVMHDLHESIPFLYISSGTGPYNAWLDPIMVDEWERMANNEVQALTTMGLPGVWTHGFYDGWAPSYLFWLATGHNSVGRFYETFGNHLPTTEDRVVRGMSDRAWYRPNPPLPQVRWSLRDNVNFQESGALLALGYAAENRQRLLEQFWMLGRRSVAKATTEGPAAYVFTADQPRRGQLRDLMQLLERHGIEVQVADQAIAVAQAWPPRTGPATPTPAPPTGGAGPSSATSAAAEVLRFPAGSFVVRLDQPSSRLADALLDTQWVRGDERVYDDTGWTLGVARNVDWSRVVDPAVLRVPMHRWDPGARPQPAPLSAAAIAVRATADTDLVRLRTALPGVRMLVAEAAVGKDPAGTVIVPLDGADRVAVARALAGLDLAVTPLARMPAVASHEWRIPRIALLHTWQGTQDEGWYRLALEDLGLPYEYLSTQAIAARSDLRAAFDVIVFPPADGTSPQDIVNGLPPGPPLPWQKTDLTPNLGVDQTADMRPGLGLSGVEALQRFVADGGLLVTVEDTARWAVAYGLARYVETVETAKLKAPGTLVRATVSDATSPVAYGYGSTVPLYFDGGPVLKVGVFDERRPGESRPSGRGSPTDPDVPQGRPFVPAPERPTPRPGDEGFQLPENLAVFYAPYLPRPEDRPRVVVSFAKEAKDLLLSGMLEGGDELAGTPALIDAPLGRGHVLLFAANPMWRANTQGDYALVVNAVLNWDRLGIGWPPAPPPSPPAGR